LQTIVVRGAEQQSGYLYECCCDNNADNADEEHNNGHHKQTSKTTRLDNNVHHDNESNADVVIATIIKERENRTYHNGFGGKEKGSVCNNHRATMPIHLGGCTSRNNNGHGRKRLGEIMIIISLYVATLRS
jgi:hypothetical protein